MDRAEFDRRLQQISEKPTTPGCTRGASVDQELARLFSSSGWNKPAISRVTGLSAHMVEELLLLGRFLAFVDRRGSTQLPPNLMAWRFAKLCYLQTDRSLDEPARFAQALDLMSREDVLSPRRRPPAWVGRLVAERFADRRWRDASTIAERIGATRDHVTRVLESMAKYGNRKCHCEKRRAGKGLWQYRIIRGSGKKIDVETLRVEVSPIIKQLRIEGRKNAATFSPATVLDLAHRLERLLEKLAK